MAFVVLLSATEMNGNFEKFKEKRRMRHAVTILVGVTILFALIIVIGIILAFELPPKNRKFAAEKVPLPEGDGGFFIKFRYFKKKFL
ncbi:unnamed protein product [Gongylonema pulchrum]|uniref:OppC_N domain-containing protein n=1 Tax=Gongylonema pulchrum TaxID=637853 RepID=A0A183EYP1_9BILA|nr:unnamed protein product [Gongylonema pulchrum]